MTSAALLANVFAWSAQVALVAMLCAPLPRLLRLPAHVQYGFWRLVLVACLALPFIQPWHVVASGMPPQPGGGAVLARVFLVRSQHGGTPVDWPSLVAVVLAGGCAFRLFWVLIGWTRLRRLRALGETVRDELAGDVSEIAAAIRVRADVRWVRGLPQPATFGLRRAVVLVPDSLREHSPDIRRAVLAHELLHVQRRDAAMVFVEELIRAATWFNPAFWWLIARVRLAREGVVDELTVLLTGARQTYLDALLLLADEAPLASSAFSRRRQLFYRVLLVSREVRMTSGRFVAATAVLALALVVTGWTAASAFPLQTVPPVLASQNPPTPPAPPPPPRDIYRNPPPPTPPPPPPPPPAPVAQPWQSPDAASAIHIGGQIKTPTKIRDVKPVYPAEALAAHVQGVVILETLIDREGNVEEIHILRSIPMLDEAAVGAVSQWKFTPTLLNGGPIPVIMTTTVNFTGQ